MRLKNTSPYPIDQINQLLRFAFCGVVDASVEAHVTDDWELIPLGENPGSSVLGMLREEIKQQNNRCVCSSRDRD